MVDEVSESIIDRETALANFDHARDDFEQVFSQVPDGALDFGPEGEDYAIIDVMPHIIWSINRYYNLLEAMEQAQDQEVREVVQMGQKETLDQHRARWATLPSKNEGREVYIAEMEQAHDRLADRLRNLAYEEYGRVTPVYYTGSEEPYATRPLDIARWLTEHYQEHIAHVQGLLEKWKQTT